VRLNPPGPRTRKAPLQSWSPRSSQRLLHPQPPRSSASTLPSLRSPQGGGLGQVPASAPGRAQLEKSLVHNPSGMLTLFSQVTYSAPQTHQPLCRTVGQGHREESPGHSHSAWTKQKAPCRQPRLCHYINIRSKLRPCLLLTELMSTRGQMGTPESGGLRFCFGWPEIPLKVHPNLILCIGNLFWPLFFIRLSKGVKSPKRLGVIKRHSAQTIGDLMQMNLENHSKIGGPNLGILRIGAWSIVTCVSSAWFTGGDRKMFVNESVNNLQKATRATNRRSQEGVGKSPHCLILQNKSPPNSVTYNYNNHKLMGFRNSLGQEFGISLSGGSGAALICRLDWGRKICLQSGSFIGLARW